jgi:hypothetical protein
MDDRQRTFLEKKRHDSFERDPRFRILEERLLAWSGDFVVFPGTEEDMDNILTRGHIYNGVTERAAGSPSNCHENAASLWEADPSMWTIFTGYALSADGLWRQHSWVMAADGVVHETTEERTMYFGFAMTDDEAGEFAWYN